jgi:ornithine carbamoyltransferase
MMTRHFLSLLDLSAADLRALIARASELKAGRLQGVHYEPLKNKVLGMIFEKSSTRTRVSFEAAMLQFGGHAIFLSPRDTQLGRGEPIEDTARILSRMVDAITIRTYEHDKLETFADHSQVPVINALTDREHPCQLLADMQTYFEHRGDIRGKTVAWLGDGNNMCHSYIHASQLLEFELRIACPEGYQPDAAIARAGGKRVKLVNDPAAAVQDADLVVTDVWASMGQEEEHVARGIAFAGFQVNTAMMARAKSDALFMHCLPAHRDEEVTSEVIDNPHSVVWEEAENRLHSQKALLELLLCDRRGE